MPNDEPLWTIQQLADFLQVSVKTVRKWRVLGRGPKALMIGKHLRWRRSDVLAWVDEQAA